MSPQTQALFLDEVAPRIRSIMPSLNPIGCEDQEEQAQDAMVIAAKLLSSAEARGKKVSAGNVSYYAAKLVRQGRRSTGQGKTDVMHPATQIAGRCRVISLEEPVAGEAESDDTMCLHDVLAARSADPSQEAAKRLDWTPLLDSLDPMAREVLLCLVAGAEVTSLVPKLKRSRSALQQDKERLGKLAIEFLGSNILTDVQRLPQWMDNLAANRERLACRYDRHSG